MVYWGGLLHQRVYLGLKAGWLIERWRSGQTVPLKIVRSARIPPPPTLDTPRGISKETQRWSSRRPWGLPGSDACLRVAFCVCVLCIYSTSAAMALFVGLCCSKTVAFAG